MKYLFQNLMAFFAEKTVAVNSDFIILAGDLSEPRQIWGIL